jgi:hypothetical protein
MRTALLGCALAALFPVAAAAAPADVGAPLGERLLEVAALSKLELTVAAMTAAELGTGTAKRLLLDAEQIRCSNCQSNVLARLAPGWGSIGDLDGLIALRGRVEALWERDRVDEERRCNDRPHLAAAYERLGRTAESDALMKACPSPNRRALVQAATTRGDAARLKALVSDRDLGGDDGLLVIRALVAAGDVAGARAIVDRLERAVRADKEAEPLIELAEKRLALGDLPAALALARRAQAMGREAIGSLTIFIRLGDLLVRAGDAAAAEPIWAWLSGDELAPWMGARYHAELGHVAEARRAVARAEKELARLEGKTRTPAAQAARAKAIQNREMGPLVSHVRFEGGHEELARASAALGDFDAALGHLAVLPRTPVARGGHHPVIDVARRAHAAKARVTPAQARLLDRLRAIATSRD